MLRNYFKVALRNIAKQKIYSTINILGLTIGFISALFVVLYVIDEFSYDQFHTDIDRMYRLGLNGKIGEQEINTTNTCPPLAAALLNEVPEVEKATRIQRWDNVVIKYEDNAYTEDRVFWADSNFFDFFDFKLLQGDPATVLKEPNSIVLTEQTARKYFGDDEALGKVLSMDNSNTAYKVTGICEDPPHNSHFHFEFLRSMMSEEWFQNSIWLNNFLHTYFIIHEKAEVTNIQEKLDEMVVKYVGPEVQQFMGISLEQFREQGGKYGYFINSAADIHLYSRLSDEIEPQSDITYVYMFGVIGIFILLIACINFMNLSTAKSSTRAKEVGMRKTFGSPRGAMIAQFLTESMIYSAFAGIAGLVGVYLLLPEFNLFTGKELDFAMLGAPGMVTTIIVLLLLIGFVAGIYPAFYLTSFNVVNVLRGDVQKGNTGGVVRSILVVFQFFISIGLIICTILVYQQIQYTQNKHLGFEKEHVVVVNNTSRLESNQSAFKNALMDESSVKAASFSNYVFPGVNNTTVFRVAGREDDHIMGTYLGDYEHVEAMGFEIIEGRNFSRDFPSDSTAVLINESAVKEIGWDEPVGKELILNNDKPVRFRVIGVLKDFNFESLKNRIRPIVLRLLNEGNYMTVRYDSNNPKEAVDLIQAKWEKFAPNEPFEFTFLDERFNELYENEGKIGTLSVILTCIAILIACLGLFGLAAYMAERRTKEIGIRKALGASTFSITTMMSREFIKLISISFILAVGPAYLFISNWLEGFAYRIDIEPWVFVISGMLGLVIALVTVSYQAIRSSLTNPVKALKYE